jgi:hypothetical protein
MSGKGKGKGGKSKVPEGRTKGKWLSSEAAGFDFLMLPYPDLVNREEGTYLLEGSNGNIKVSVTSENWDTLRFNTKSMNPEYFPSSYLKPVPTDPPNKDLIKRGFSSGLSFPRSTIAGTLEELRILLRCSPVSKSTKISAETYRALSLDASSEALDVNDKATASKRISAFLRLCAAFIPCGHEEYDEAVEKLNAEVADSLADAKLTLEDVQGNFVPNVVKSESEATSVLLQVLYALQLGHVQFLMADYKAWIIDAYPNAFAKVRPPRLGKDGRPKGIQDVGSAAVSSDNTVDMLAVDDDDGTNGNGLLLLRMDGHRAGLVYHVL